MVDSGWRSVCFLGDFLVCWVLTCLGSLIFSLVWLGAVWCCSVPGDFLGFRFLVG